MPRKYSQGGESRLSLEGLKGATIKGRTVRSIYAHGEARRKRTVTFEDGTVVNMRIYTLIGHLIANRG